MIGRRFLPRFGKASASIGDPATLTAGPGHRRFHSDCPPDLLENVQKGVMASHYRGIPFLKSPFDIGIYLQMLSTVEPQTVIEIGTKHGGSALWFADMLTAAGVKGPSVISIDIEAPPEFDDPRIEFLRCDAADLSQILPDAKLASLPRPLVVVEDSSHFYEHSMAVLRFFDSRLRPGDMIVIEDGIVSQLPEKKFARYEDGPNRAVADFLAEASERYEIASELCDHYGNNLTYNPNGYLRRLRD